MTMLSVQDHDSIYSIERATQLGAEKFGDIIDPVLAQNWIKKLERVFYQMVCPADKRVLLVSIYLTVILITGECLSKINLETRVLLL